MTCGALKDHYKQEACCGQPDKVLSQVPGAASCPYNFNKPLCQDAEPQAPRDLTPNAPGQMDPKAAVLTSAQAAFLPQVNVHYHLGAEHKSTAYSDDSHSTAYDNSRRLASSGSVRPGFMCDTSSLSAQQLQPYSFQYCTGMVQVGMTYEVHYVHSSAGYTREMVANTDIDLLGDGLGGAANGRGLLNPMVVVQAQVFQIVQGGTNVTDLVHGWQAVAHNDAVMYAGSTTGPSHDNSVCSPYFVTWHVDRQCHQVSPEAFDNMCKKMIDLYGMAGDLAPHGSRKILDPRWVVKPQYVTTLA